MDSANSDAIMGGNRTLRAQSPFEQVDHDDDDGAPPLFLFGACGETCWFTRAWNRKVQETHTDTQTGSWDSSAMWNGISHSLGTKKMFVWAMEGFDAHLIHYSKGLLFVKTFFLPVIFFLIRSAVSALFLFYLIWLDFLPFVVFVLLAGFVGHYQYIYLHLKWYLYQYTV